MKYFLVVIFVFGHVAQTNAGDLKKPGYFGFTRGCIDVIESNYSATPPCITSMTGSFALDIMLSPFQTIAKIANALEAPERDKSTSSSSTSEKKLASGPEIPEEKKIQQKISLIMLAADDARGYLSSGNSSPLLESAVAVLRSNYSEFNGKEDFTVESQKILELESRLLQIIDTEQK